MAQHRRNRASFWVFLLLVVLGAGWFANQERPWPLSVWFAPSGGQAPQQDAEAVVQPIAEPQTTPSPATATQQIEPAVRDTETESAENASPAQEPAAGQSAAVEDAPSAAAGSPDAIDPAASSGAAASSQAEDRADELADATAADDETEANDLADGTVADDQTEADGLAGAGDLAPDGSSAPLPAASAETESAAATDVVPGAGPEEAAGGTDLAAIPAPDDAFADTAAGAIGDASAPATALAEEPEAQPVGAAQTEPGAAAAAIAAAGDGPEPDEAEAADPPAQEVAALLSDAKDTAPSFDVVRIEPDGRAVIAGRAAPGADVELRSGDEVIDRVRASRRGDWVAIPGKPLSPGDQQLTAVAALKGAPAVESQQMVVVAVPERAIPVAGQASPVTPKPMAVLLPRSGRGTGRILQAPGRLSAQGTLALMSVGYDHLGKMLLSGEAPPGVPVHVYLDNRLVATVVGDANGTWSTGLDEALAPGTYTLRLDQLDADGQTVARIETPITRVSEPPIEGDLQVDYVVVQPGNSLWRIARRLSGKGIDYVYIFDRNQAQIRDPDLIFPGQVFQIPPEVETAG